MIHIIAKKPHDFDEQFTKLKSNLREAGFTSWEWVDPYEYLVVSFKSSKVAKKAFYDNKDLILYLSKSATLNGDKIEIETYDE